MQTKAKEHPGLLELVDGKRDSQSRFSLGASRGNPPVGNLISGLLEKNTFLLSEATEFVLICLSGPRKLIHPASHSGFWEESMSQVSRCNVRYRRMASPCHVT